MSAGAADSPSAGRVETRPPTAVVVITALLLAGYLGVIGWAWASPATDPQHGMAEGFLMLVTLFVVGLASLLWIGAARGRRKIVWTVFGVSACFRL